MHPGRVESRQNPAQPADDAGALGNKVLTMVNQQADLTLRSIPPTRVSRLIWRARSDYSGATEQRGD